MSAQHWQDKKGGGFYTHYSLIEAHLSCNKLNAPHSAKRTTAIIAAAFIFPAIDSKNPFPERAPRPPQTINTIPITPNIAHPLFSFCLAICFSF